MKYLSKMKYKLLAIVSLTLFIVLAFVAHFIPFFPMDIFFSHYIQGIKWPFFSIFMVIISSLGFIRVLPFAILIIGVTMIGLKQKTEALIWLLSVVSATAMDSVIKVLVNRPRPVGSLVVVYSHLTDKSFPSGHVFIYTVLFGLLFYYANVKVKGSFYKYLLMILVSIPVLLVGVSRIYLGAHWASDVLGGYLIGIFWLYISINYYRKFNLLHINK